MVIIFRDINNKLRGCEPIIMNIDLSIKPVDDGFIIMITTEGDHLDKVYPNENDAEADLYDLAEKINREHEWFESEFVR